ncbi:hypothetical protein NMY22_g17151 [Coprinellus aureogranulatus]|nr:hypothetical protein NMY22_g17151 [Coprinellus aureogranulatus]
MAKGNKAAKLRNAEKRVNERVLVDVPTPAETKRIATELSISGNGSSQSSKPLRPATLPLDALHSSLPEQPFIQPKGSVSTVPLNGTTATVEPSGKSAESASKPSQTTSLLNEFDAYMPQLMDLLFEAQCPLMCEYCFINAHKHNPLHWAESWNSELSCFVRTDISTLSPSFAIHLEHCGNPCPSSYIDQEGNFIETTLVTLNGVHRTRVRFCTCKGIPDRVGQLMVAGFFPASVKRPKTAFSFEVLDHFERLQLECKVSAYDFCSCLRRATDDAFTSKVPDIFPQFVVATQVWGVMMETKRLGQAHGIDHILTHRRAGNLIVHCPMCPEPHMNLEGAWREIPELLKHLCQLQLTTDGNHQLNHYAKNTDPLNKSLFAGRAQFPTDEVLESHLRPIQGEAAEKSTCTNLNAANKQDRKKFKNMDITGVVNIQCSHVFVKSTVDLQMGERFDNTDLAYAQTLGLYRCLDVTDISLRHIIARDTILSYDIACGYLIKIRERFLRSFPHLVSAVSRTRGMIPAVHIQNHQDNCMYMYSGAYLPNAGHFHGETAEQYWVESNQLGASARQMNKGRRYDANIKHHNWWNQEKSKQAGETLEAETAHARETYQQHKARFNSLCDLHSDKLASWNERDRSELKRQGRDVESVYRYSLKTKVPSQKSVLEALQNKGSQTPISSKARKSDAVSEAEFIDEGISIQTAQRQLALDIAHYEQHFSVTAEKGVKTDSQKLKKRIEMWRGQQQIYMPQVSSDILSQAAEDLGVSKEKLFLPSD